jgi:hypothetical protein
LFVSSGEIGDIQNSAVRGEHFWVVFKKDKQSSKDTKVSSLQKTFFVGCFLKRTFLQYYSSLSDPPRVSGHQFLIF